MTTCDYDKIAVGDDRYSKLASYASATFNFHHQWQRNCSRVNHSSLSTLYRRARSSAEQADMINPDSLPPRATSYVGSKSYILRERRETPYCISSEVSPVIHAHPCSPSLPLRALEYPDTCLYSSRWLSRLQLCFLPLAHCNLNIRPYDTALGNIPTKFVFTALALHVQVRFLPLAHRNRGIRAKTRYPSHRLQTVSHPPSYSTVI